MAAVSLFRDTNMATMTSCENTLFVSKVEIGELSPTVINRHEKTLRHDYKRAPNLISVTPENRRNNLPTYIYRISNKIPCCP